MSKIVKSTQSCSNGHLPYHLFILVLSARAQCMTWHAIRVRSKDAQKQLARTSLIYSTLDIRILFSSCLVHRCVCFQGRCFCRV